MAKRTFLIADDSHEKIHFFRHMLKVAEWSGNVLVAMTTEEAKRLIDLHPDIEAAFIDYYIPSEYGPAVIRYLKKANPAARVALVSSADSERNAVEAREAGAEAVVCSSYPLQEVEERLQILLAEWKAEL